MLDKTEIALLEVAKKEIDKKMAMKGKDKKQLDFRSLPLSFMLTVLFQADIKSDEQLEIKQEMF